MPSDEGPYKAPTLSRFHTPVFQAVFASMLRSLKLLQSCRAAFDRQVLEKDFKTIASVNSADIMAAALHESKARTAQDVLRNTGNEKVRAALRHLVFFTATVPFTDGHKMRLKHLGCAMNIVFGPLVDTHKYGDNCAPEMPLPAQEQHDVVPSAMRRMLQETFMPSLQDMHRRSYN